MTKRLANLLAFVAILAFGQTLPPPAALTAYISGAVKDKTTGAPLKNFVVSTDVRTTAASGNATTRTVTSATDEQGRYKLTGLPPAQYRVQTVSPEGFVGGTMTRLIATGGRDLENVDFNFTLRGSISGRVLDENKEPVPNIFVLLVSKEYYLGALGHFMSGAVSTNDEGRYSFPTVESGRTYYLVTDVRRRNIAPHSEVPQDPKMRRFIPMRTWFPSSPDRNGAAPVQLRPGERREGVDIEVKKSPSYCIGGIASTPNGPGVLGVDIEGLQPSSGASNGGGFFLVSTHTNTGADGEFRFCDLSPGSYRVTVADRKPGPEPTAAVVAVTVSDRDLTDLKIPTSPGVSIDAEVVLEGVPPATPVAVKANVSLTPLLRTQMPGEKTGARLDVPGTATLSGLLLDDYGIRATINGPGLYIKDVTYAGRSVRYEPLHLGSAIAGATLRVAIGQDGAILTAKVTDKDGNPVADGTIIVMPSDAISEGTLAARIVSGQTDQTGQYTSGTLAPGKYYVVATGDSFDMTPESIGGLWQSHTRYQEVELAPSATKQVNLQPVSIR